MAFTSWDDLKDDIKDAAVDKVSSGVKSVTLSDGKTIQYSSIDELRKALALVNDMEHLGDAGNPATRVSYGRHRRFR